LPIVSITSTIKSWGQIGYEFTVTGSNFGDTSSTVKFYLNSLKCPLTKWTATQIKAKVPIGAPRGYYHQIVSPTLPVLPCTTATANFRVYKPEGF
jgi:hypothetical protein